MKKIVLALAFLCSFMLVAEAKEPTIEELISEVEKICESGKDFTNKNGTMKYVEACSYLGAVYEGIPEVGNLGIKKDLAKAFKFHKKACGGGYALSCFGLAGFYLEGKAVEKDNKKALEFFQKACNAGYKEGCTIAATMSGNDADMAKVSAQQKKIAIITMICLLAGCLLCLWKERIIKRRQNTIKKPANPAKRSQIPYFKTTLYLTNN
ncbi:Sel1 domain repeat-containing protein [Campylobacter showae]|uniref:beta-lactamase n=1 Tax=Campylobacter showae RM3277 TaxID=553219 RepID=C6RCL0_9BACT|nr:Sel1 repeat protein [Campylobacter showae]EET80869.1 Sel1 repeat protein [Campylobacter showae RM3277]QCD49792.1 Sel1 domain repeat-containing protein [Campylobacter showae]